MAQASKTRLNSLPKREPDFIEPMECDVVSKLPEGSDWICEVKLGGYRAIGVKASGDAILYSSLAAVAWGKFGFDAVTFGYGLIVTCGLK